MKVQLDFTINNAANPFHQARWFVVGLPLSLNGFKRCPRKNRKRALMNDLISSIKLWNNKVDRRPVGQHAMLKSIFIGPEAGEWG